MTSILSNVGFMLLLLSSAGDCASASTDIFSMDIFLVESFNCFWHVMCNISEPLKIKKAADEIQEPQKEFVLREVVPLLDEHLRVLTSVEDFNSDTFWVNDLQVQACAWPKEERDKFLTEMYSPFIEHFSEICFDEEKADQCDAVNRANKVYHEMEAEMISKKECNISSHKYNFPQM